MTNDEKNLVVGLYDWSLQATGREIDSDCETLSRLKSSSARVYSEFIAASRNKAAARSSGLALVKRFQLSALDLKGEEFTSEDQQLVDDFISFARFKRFATKDHSAIMKARGKIPRGVLAKALGSRIDPILGKPEPPEGGVWKYETVAGPFRVVTYVDLGGRLPLRYSHKIIAKNGRTFYETSLLHWHGITTETAWDLMGPKDTDSSVELLAELCKRFLKAIETICRDSRIDTGTLAPDAC